jgi:serine/threonine protein kinase
MWAIGCIMGELTDGKPLFPGESEIDQLYCIQKVMGPLTDEQTEAFQKNPRFIGLKFPENRPETLEKRYMGKLSKIALDFMNQLLRMDPKERLTSSEALRHPYFRNIEDYSFEDRPPTSSSLLRNDSAPKTRGRVAIGAIPQNFSSYVSSTLTTKNAKKNQTSNQNSVYAAHLPRSMQPPPSRNQYNRQSVYPKQMNDIHTFENDIYGSIPDITSQQSARQLPQIHHPGYAFFGRDGKRRKDEDPDQGGGPPLINHFQKFSDEAYNFTRQNQIYNYDLYSRKKVP